MKTHTFAQSRLLCGLTVTLLPLLISANATLAAPPSAAPPKDATAAMPPQAGFYRMKLGQFTITALSDGTLPLSLHELLLDVTPAEIDRSLAHDFLNDPTQTSVNAYLIDTGSRLILVDTGAGDLFGPSVGFLNASLSAAGVRREQISDVLLTHIHADHSGGLMNGKALAFPNATLHVARRETDFWLNPANFVQATEANRKRAIEAHSKVDPYIKAGKVKTFEDEAELFPGIRTMAAPGHTPGHTIYVLESQGQKLMFWGDIMHAASVQFPEPDVAINFDIAPKTAVITRQKLLRDAAAQRYWVALDHVSFPGIGHVRAEKVGWSWAPINYSDDGTGQWKNQLPPADVWRQLANREAQDLETLNSKSKKAVKNGGAAKQHRKRRPIGVASAMTPLQYQKQLRLQEARRLMSSEGLDAARAGYAVGYGDPSYFSRDYKRVFGEPPRQHAARGHSEVW